MTYNLWPFRQILSLKGVKQTSESVEKHTYYLYLKQIAYCKHTWFPEMWTTLICFLVQWQSVQYLVELWVPPLPAS